ncbi:MAG: MBL fold metallo-hydrolase [Clostridia bacterium]|nr:MBL fold metallo-hydrolase [Clostridia bacterium]
MKRIRLFILCLCLILCFTACAAPTVTPSKENDQLRLHVIDVGQGDSTFLELPGGKTMLIDAGERDYGGVVKSYIRQLGYDKLDIVVASHPHSDHIGGLAEVIEAFAVGQVWMPKKASTTATFEKLLKTVKNKGLQVNTAKAGKQILAEEGLTIDIISPTRDDYGDEMNLYSAVIRITHGTQRFLIMGDAETENEEEMTGVAAEFIRVGHHGSKTSSSAAFVKRVGAKYAVISVGTDNSYGLPKDEIIKRWQKAGATVYRTDESGTLRFVSDGKIITVETGIATSAPQTETSPQSAWVLNISSKKIHRPDCSSVEKIKAANKQTSNRAAEDLLKEGYTPCGSCDPLEN